MRITGMDSGHLIAEDGELRFRSDEQFDSYPDSPNVERIKWVPFGRAVQIPAVFAEAPATADEDAPKPKR